MQRLDESDVTRIGTFVAESAEIPLGDEPFAPAFLGALRRLVPCDFVSYAESDRVRCRLLEFAEDPVYDGPEPEVGLSALTPDDPLWGFLKYADASGDFRAYRLSDFVGARQLSRSPYFAAWYRTTGVVHQLRVGLDAPLWHTKVFRFDRGRGTDFSEQDRAVLDALRPYFLARWTLWQVSRDMAPVDLDAVGLTVREREVLALLAEGLTNGEIAQRLWIAPSTVRRHLENIYAKLGVHTRTAAVRVGSHVF